MNNSATQINTINSAATTKEINAVNKGKPFYLNNIMEKNTTNDDIFNTMMTSITINDICILFGIDASNEDVQKMMKEILPKIINLYKEYAIATDPDRLLYFLTPLTFYVMSNYYIYKNISSNIIIDHYEAIQPIINTMKIKFLKETQKPFLQLTDIAGGGKMKGGVVGFLGKIAAAAAAVASIAYTGIGYVADMGIATALGATTVVGTSAYLYAIPASVNTLDRLPSQTQQIAKAIRDGVASGFESGWWTVQSEPANAGNVSGAIAKKINPKTMDPIKKQEIIDLKVAELMGDYLSEQHLLRIFSPNVNAAQVEKAVEAGVNRAINIMVDTATEAAAAVTEAAAAVTEAATVYGEQGMQAAAAYGEQGIQTIGKFYDVITAEPIYRLKLPYDTSPHRKLLQKKIVDDKIENTVIPTNSRPEYIEVGNIKSYEILDNSLIKERENSKTVYNSLENNGYSLNKKITQAIVYDKDSIKIIYVLISENYKPPTKTTSVQNPPIFYQETYNYPSVPSAVPSALPATTASASPLPSPSPSIAAAAVSSSPSIAVAAKRSIASPSPSIAVAASASPSASPSASAPKINISTFVVNTVDNNLYKTVQFLEWLKNNGIIDLKENSSDFNKIKETIFDTNGKLKLTAITDLKTKLIEDNKGEIGTTFLGYQKAGHNTATNNLMLLNTFTMNALVNPLSLSGNMGALLLHISPNGLENNNKIVKNLLIQQVPSINTIINSIDTSSEILKKLFPTSDNPTETFIQLFDPTYKMYKTLENINTKQQQAQVINKQRKALENIDKLPPANQVIRHLSDTKKNRSPSSYYTELSNYAAPIQVLIIKYLPPTELHKLKNSNSLDILRYLIFGFTGISSVMIQKLRRKGFTDAIAPAVMTSLAICQILEAIINLSEEQHTYAITIAKRLMEQGFKTGSKMGTYYAKNNIEWTKWATSAVMNTAISGLTHIFMPMLAPLLNSTKSIGTLMGQKLKQIEGKTCEQSRDEILRYISDNNGQRKTATTINTVKDRYQQMSNNRSCISMEQQSIITEYITPAPTTALGGATCLSGGKRRYKKTKKAPKYKKRKMTRRR